MDPCRGFITDTEKEVAMGVVIGRLDDQVAKIFLGNNLTKSTEDYQKILEDESVSPEVKEKILAAQKKKEEEDIIL